VGISTERHSLGELQLYPNPARDLLHVNLGTEPEKEGEIRIADLSGKRVFEDRIRAGIQIQVLDISALTEGMYMIYRMEEGVITDYSKFVKSR
jgi:hypothetical protein